MGTGGRRLRLRHGKKDAERNNEAARLWISGLETVNRKLGVPRVINLSATPFFLRGSGYAEGMLFPWMMSDFSLMDAIECGIVKLPRVPVAENIPGDDMPMSKLVYDYVSGFHRQKDDGFSTLENGRLALFSNFDEHGNPLPRPDTLLIDSEQLESGEALDDDSRGMAADEIERFHREIVVLVDDGHGADDLLHLVVEIKGYRREDAKEKKATMDTYWVPAVNNLRTLGRWAFAELTEIYQIESDFKAKVASEFNELIARAGSVPPALSA